MIDWPRLFRCPTVRAELRRYTRVRPRIDLRAGSAIQNLPNCDSGEESRERCFELLGPCERPLFEDIDGQSEGRLSVSRSPVDECTFF